MRLAIEHHADYAHDAPSAFSVQYVRLSPRHDPGQRTLRWTLDAPGKATTWRDGFGNVVHCLVQDSRRDHLRLTAVGEVETGETHGIVPLNPAEPAPEAFLRPTALTGADETIRDFLGPLARLRAKGGLAALHGLVGALHDRVAFEPDAPHALSTASETLARGGGMCQDHAHLFIACCRAWGIPARYVSGYLHTDARDGRHLATHAWAEALVDYLGWVSFDPPNRQSATPAYVRLAVAFDEQGAAPIRGLRLGGGHEDVSVRVQRAQANQ
jgi:Transglutaminase-like enzymes, putative cysteine proteases